VSRQGTAARCHEDNGAS